MFLKFAVRDLSLLGLCLLTWWLLTVRLADAGPALAVALSVVAVVLSALVTYLIHEWGHLTGAVAAGSVVYAPNKLVDPFLFHFDSRSNDARQFVWMSTGGLFASVAVLALLIAVLPFGEPLARWAAWMVLALVVIGVIATLVREVPEAWRVARGGALPTGMVYEPFPAPQR